MSNYKLVYLNRRQINNQLNNLEINNKLVLIKFIISKNKLYQSMTDIKTLKF